MVGLGVFGGMQAGVVSGTRRRKKKPTSQITPQPTVQPPVARPPVGVQSGVQGLQSRGQVAKPQRSGGLGGIAGAHRGAGVVVPSKAIPGVQQADEQKIIDFLKQKKPNASREELKRTALQMGGRLKARRTESFEAGRPMEEKRMKTQKRIGMAEKITEATKKFIPGVGGFSRFGEEVTTAPLEAGKNIVAGAGAAATELGQLATDVTVKQLEKKGSISRFVSPVLGKKFAEKAGDTSVAEGLAMRGEESGIGDKMNAWSMEKFGVPIGTPEAAVGYDIGDKDSAAYRGSKAIFEMVEAASGFGLGKKTLKKGAKVVQKNADEIAEGGTKLLKKMGFSDDAARKIAKQTADDIVEEPAKKIAKKIKKPKLPKLRKEKQKILDIVSVKETKKAREIAFDQNRLVTDNRSKLRKLLFGKKAGDIVPDKRVRRAVDVISEQIKKPSKDPTILKQQMDNLITNKAVKLKSSMKDMPIGTMTQAKKVMKDSIDELATLSDEFTKADVKKMRAIMDKIDSSKTANGLRDIRKQWDNMFSDAAKGGSNSPTPSTRKAYRMWKETRDVLNKGLDDIGKKFGDETISKEFADLSALYEGKQNMLSKAGDFAKSTEGFINKKTIALGGLGILANKARKSISGGN